MKRTYVKPMAKKLDYSYEEQVTANSGNSYWGKIGSYYEHLDLCQMGVNSAGISTCKHYFYSTDVCSTTEMPMSLRPWS